MINDDERAKLAKRINIQPKESHACMLQQCMQQLCSSRLSTSKEVAGRFCWDREKTGSYDSGEICADIHAIVESFYENGDGEAFPVVRGKTMIREGVEAWTR
jgi:hypothetical protein